MSDYLYEKSLEKYIDKAAAYEVALYGIKEVLDQAIELLSAEGNDNTAQAKKLLETALKKYWG